MAAKICHLLKRKFLEIGATWRWILFELIVIVVACNLLLFDPDKQFEKNLFGKSKTVIADDLNLSSVEYFK